MTTGKTREFLLEKKYLNFPVKNGVEKRLVSLVVDDQVVREFEIELAPGEPNFWVFLEIGEFKGKKALLRIDTYDPAKNKGFDSIYQADTYIGEEDVYREKLRPQFHFTSRRGWNNDSNGMVYYDGEYHLFYQHNPYGWRWAAGGTNPMSKGQPFTQSIAYSNDRGRTWTVYEGNPVLNHINGGNRDPKVIWHQPTNQWVMALYLDDHTMGFFTSKDLKSWEFQSKLKCFHECPELFELPVDGNANNKKWILYGGSGEYLIGSFDGRQFEAEAGPIPFHYGNCFYASQTFNNIPPEDGRRIQIAWGRITMPRMPFNQMMLFPVTLTLWTMDDGPRMFAEPIHEIKRLHKRRWQWTNRILKPQSNLLSDLSGELFHIRAEFQIDDASENGFIIRGVPVVYNIQKQELSCCEKNAPLKAVDGKIHLELLVDRTSIEIFGDDGKIYMPIGVVLADNAKSLEIFTKGGDTEVESLEVYELDSAWR
ncbi:MAG: glycoside hydrolase family 32 protein [Sedimentisphaerales bacterium]